MSKARETVETLRTVLVDGDVTNANFTGADLEIGKGGTGASSAGAARTALGLVVGTDVLAPDGDGSALTGVDSLPSQTSQSGKFLTTNGSAASWGTVASGMTLLSTVTANASSTVTLSGLDATYDDYVIIMSAARFDGTDNNRTLYARLTIGGSEVTTDKYRYAIHSSTSGGQNLITPSAGKTFLKLHGISYAGTNVFASMSLTMHIPSPSRTDTIKGVYWDAINITNGECEKNNGMGVWGDNSSMVGALTAIKFYPSAGTITSGVFKLYGIRKS